MSYRLIYGKVSYFYFCFDFLLVFGVLDLRRIDSLRRVRASVHFRATLKHGAETAFAEDVVDVICFDERLHCLLCASGQRGMECQAFRSVVFFCKGCTGV